MGYCGGRKCKGPEDESCHLLCMKWIAQILLGTRHYSRSLDNIRGVDDSVLEELGLDERDWHREERNKFKDEIRSRLKAYLKSSRSRQGKRTGNLFNNVRLLSEALKLSQVEDEVFAFAAASNGYKMLGDIAKPFADMAAEQIYHLVATATGIDGNEVRSALSAGSILCSSGLVVIGRKSHQFNDQPLRMLETLSNSMLQEHRDVESLLSGCFKQSPDTSLELESFSYIGEPLDLLARYMSLAVRVGKKGVNILVHGAPGVGKTELARVLAKSAGARLYEVLVNDEDGDAARSSKRLDSYRLCCTLLRYKSGSVILFDEAEESFPSLRSSDFGPLEPSGENKGFMTRLLEENPVPTIWITNSIWHMDKAYLRRFDMVFEVKNPPCEVREKLIADKFRAIKVRPEWIARLAKAENLTPADMEKAAKVMEALGGDDFEKNERMAEQVLRGNLGARRLSLAAPRVSALETVYNLSYLNTTEDIRVIASRISSKLKGTVLLYGPSGTGKTAFAYHVGEISKKPVLVKKASDLLSMWVGGSEANIAHMFQEAGEKGAVLLLDEADSFLGERRGANHSWEVTQVNELLVQMENFSGLFICSTNLMDRLDQAVFRRFDLKIRFDYPTAEQRWRLFEAHMKDLGFILDAAASAPLRAELDKLEVLTPGDFATVKRKNRMLENITNSHAFLKALAEECKVKPEGKGVKSIGF